MSYKHLSLFFFCFFAFSQEATDPQTPLLDFEKTLRFEEEKNHKPAVKFWLDLVENGRSRAVSAGHVFRDGDRTRFQVQSNVDGYLYVAHQGNDGSRVLLFPSIDSGRDNFVRAKQQKTMPGNRGFFVFDDRSGDERLLVIISPTRLPKLEALARKKIANQGATKNERARISAKSLGQEERLEWDQFFQEFQTKTIYYEADDASYRSSPKPAFNRPLILPFTLKHR